MEFQLAELAGPLGGSLALAFACGAAAGYQFSERTAVKYAMQRVKELQAVVEKVETEYKEQIEEQKEEHKKQLNAQNEVIYSMQKRLQELEESRLHLALNNVDAVIENLEVTKKN